MKICIIGYKNHSLRLKKILDTLGYKDVYLFNHNTDKFENILNHDAFFISSPNNTHIKWIQKLKNLDKYIFCEKPPVTTLKDLKKIISYNPKLYFNFNQRFTKLSILLKEYVKSKKIGTPLYVSCINSTGLAFKESFKNNWRFESEDIFSSIVGNVGIHYIDMIGYIFGGIDNIEICNSHITSKKLPDTSKITLTAGTVQGDVFLSYAAPFHNEIKVVFDNGILLLKDGTLSVETPRDTFDNQNRFISPKKEILFNFLNTKEYLDESLKESIKFFLYYVSNNLPIPEASHNQSINTTKKIMEKIL